MPLGVVMEVGELRVWGHLAYITGPCLRSEVDVTMLQGTRF